MTVPPPEDETPQGHPAWDEYLKDVPEDFRQYVTPAFEAWDKGVVPRSKLQEVETQYNPYKEFVEAEIDADELGSAYNLYQAMQENPEEVIRKAIETFGLESVLNAAPVTPDPDDDDEDEGYPDVTKNPAFTAMQEKLAQFEEKETERERLAREAQEEQEFDAYLGELTEKYKETGPFDVNYVTALIAQDVDGDEAVKQYYAMVNQAVAARTNSQQAPDQPLKVMGGDGATGSGIPQVPTKMGDLNKNQLADVVAQFLENQDKA